MGAGEAVGLGHRVSQEVVRGETVKRGKQVLVSYEGQNLE